MKNGRWMTAKDVLRVNAGKWPDKIGIKDLYKSYTFKEWNERSCRLTNTLMGLGMKKGDTLRGPRLQLCRMDGDLWGSGKGRFYLCTPHVQTLCAGNGI